MTNDYGPVFGELLEVDRLRALDEGSPDGANRSRLETLTVEARLGMPR